MLKGLMVNFYCKNMVFWSILFSFFCLFFCSAIAKFVAKRKIGVKTTTQIYVWMSSSAQKWKKTRDRVSAAVGSYVSCSSVNCSCHLRWVFFFFSFRSACRSNIFTKLTSSSWFQRSPTGLAAFQRWDLRKPHGFHGSARHGHPLPDHPTQAVQRAELHVPCKVHPQEPALPLIWTPNVSTCWLVRLVFLGAAAWSISSWRWLTVCRTWRWW